MQSYTQQAQLTNLGTLPVDRIHSMLRFAPDYSGHTEAELAAFMVAMQKEGKVDSLPNNMWKLTEVGKAS